MDGAMKDRIAKKYPAKRVRVVTEYYEFSHGKKPRGSGLWFFSIAGEQFYFRGSYGHAKWCAQEKASELGVTEAEVLA